MRACQPARARPTPRVARAHVPPSGRRVLRGGRRAGGPAAPPPDAPQGCVSLPHQACIRAAGFQTPLSALSGQLVQGSGGLGSGPDPPARCGAHCQSRALHVAALRAAAFWGGTSCRASSASNKRCLRVSGGRRRARPRCLEPTPSSASGRTAASLVARGDIYLG